MKGLLLGLGLGSLGLAVGFVAGRGSAPQVTWGAPLLAQAQQAPDDPRELIPLTPGRGPNGGPGQGQQPGQGQGQQPGGNCPITFFKDGQFYQMQPGPGQQPGQPGQGQGDQGQGAPGGDNELFPMTPIPGPQNSPFTPLPPDPSRRS